ncbi:MAG: hypothetical protein HY514_02720 [Candidatus Aenigmarchaeota archaeon]|nr:hypothetical protein [Candidatus Aenigmarchaeota archaeon]
MAKRRSRSRARPRARRVKRPHKSLLTREQLYLNQHDEEKVLLFTTGIVLGVGLAASLLDKFLFGGLVALVVALVLIFIESSQKYHG